MSSKNSNKLNVPEARAAMDKFKMEAASEVGAPSLVKDFSTKLLHKDDSTISASESSRF